MLLVVPLNPYFLVFPVFLISIFSCNQCPRCSSRQIFRNPFSMLLIYFTYSSIIYILTILEVFFSQSCGILFLYTLVSPLLPSTCYFITPLISFFYIIFILFLSCLTCPRCSSRQPPCYFFHPRYPLP